MVAPRRERLVQLLERVDLDLECVQVRGAAAHQRDRGGDPAGSGDVVVLDHRAVEEAEAVRRAAAVHDRLFSRARRPGVVLRVAAMRALVPEVSAT